jgi:hypothetical protein
MTRKPHELSLMVRGKVGGMVYQRVRKGLGNLQTVGKWDLQLREPGDPIDRRSPAQLRLRARLAAATATYQALSEAERDAWRERAEGSRKTGYNLFVRDFCERHPASEF